MEAEDLEAIKEPVVQVTSTSRALDFLAENIGLKPALPLTFYGTVRSHLIPQTQFLPFPTKIILVV